MKGSESRQLQEAWAVDLLSADEELAIAAHLEDCDPCQAHWDALSGVHVEMREAIDAECEAPLPIAVREAVLAGALDAIAEGRASRAAPDPKTKAKHVPPAQPTADAQALGIRVVLNCSYCHAPTDRVEVTFCATCLAPHHRECFSAHGRCSTLGCNETRTVRPMHPDVDPDASPQPYRTSRRLWGGLGMAVLVSGAIAAFLPTDDAPLPVSGAAGDQPLSAAVTSEVFAEPSELLLGNLRQAVRKGDQDGADQALTDLLALCNLVSLEHPRLRTATQLRVDEARALRRKLADRIDLVVEDEPLEVVCERLSQAAGRDIAPVASVNELVTASMRNVTWEDALTVVARNARCRIEERPGNKLTLTQPPRVTIQFTDANVRTVIEVLSDKSGRSIGISDHVRGSVTVDLKEVFWDEALLSIVHTVGDFVVAREGDDTLLVTIESDAERRGSEILTLNRWKPRSRETLSLDEHEEETEPPSVSLDHTDADVRDVVADLAAQAGRPITVHSAVGATVSVSAKEVTWDHALRLIAGKARCRVEVEGEVLLLTQEPRVTIQFTDANVRTVIQLLAAYSGKNITLSPEVRGNVTLDVTEAPWDAVLKAVTETVGDYRVRAISDTSLRVVTRSSVAFGETPKDEGELELARYWSLIPPEDLRVYLSGPATLEGYCAQITQQTGLPIVAPPGGSPFENPVGAGRRWRDALRQLTSRRDVTVRESLHGVVISPSERNTLRAFQGNVRTWLQLLGSLADEDFVISPEVRGEVTIELQDATYPDALEAAIKAHGLRSGEVQGVRWIAKGERYDRTRIVRPKLETVDLGGDGLGFDQPVRSRHVLSAVALSFRQHAAIINDRIYRLGDRLINEATDEPTPMIVAHVMHDGVLLLHGKNVLQLRAVRQVDGSYVTAEHLNQTPYRTAGETPMGLMILFLDYGPEALARNEAIRGQLEQLAAQALPALLRLIRNPNCAKLDLILDALPELVEAGQPHPAVRAQFVRALEALLVPGTPLPISRGARKALKRVRGS